MSKLLTIAIPTYNRKKYLDKALRSIYSQYDARVEVIVSDNCSEDGTMDFVQNCYPEVIYFRNEENVGMENFKRCYDHAKGKFVLLLGDDDIVVDGKLRIILDFLESNHDLKMVFLNHSFFRDVFDGNTENSFIPVTTGNFIVTDKDKFIDVVKDSITFISCMIVSKQAYLLIDDNDIKKYGRNLFLHTCIEFEITKDINSKLGIISNVCIAKYQPSSELNVSWYIDTFVVVAHYVLTEVGVNCGYSRSKMNSIFSNWICRYLSIFILLCKIKNESWKETFWRKAFPVIKRYIKSWFTIIPVVFVPAWLAKIAYAIKQKFKRR